MSAGAALNLYDVGDALLEIQGTAGTLSMPDPNMFGGPVRVRRLGETDWREIPLTHAHTGNDRCLGVADLAGESILPPEAVLYLCDAGEIIWAKGRAGIEQIACVDSAVYKPDANFMVQVKIDQVPPPGIVPPEMELVSVYMQLAIDTCFWSYEVV